MLNFDNGNSNKNVNQGSNKRNKSNNQNSSIMLEYLQALMSNNRVMIAEINDMKLANEQDVRLIELVNKLWTNDINVKKESFSSLVLGLNTTNKTIAYMLITAYQLIEGNLDEAIEYSVKTKMFLVGTKGIPTEISSLLSLHISILIGETKINDLMKIPTLTTEVTKGYFNYLRALFNPNKKRTNSANSANLANQKLLRDAIASFRKVNNLYLLALAQAKLAECEVEQSEAENLLSNSVEIFETLGRKTELARTQLLLTKYSTTIKAAQRIGGLVYASEKMAQIKQQILDAASCNYPVLIMGPSGSGKELIARAIHENSKRFRKPLIAVNCGVLTENLTSSELFGHIKGAFTGADRDTKGFVGSAEGGTLFLDEIGELSRKTQGALLRLIDNSEYQRLGTSVPQKADVRIIAATNQNVAELAELDKAKTGQFEGNGFKHDLFNRFMIKINVPPLSERPEDVLVIINEILIRENAGYLNFDLEAKDYLQKRHYEHNVRELEEVVKTAIIIAKRLKTDTITLEILKEKEEQNPHLHTAVTTALTANKFTVTCPTINYQESMAFFEKRLLEQILKLANKNVSKVVELSGIAKTTLYRRLALYGIKLVEN